MPRDEGSDFPLELAGVVEQTYGQLSSGGGAKPEPSQDIRRQPCTRWRNWRQSPLLRSVRGRHAVRHSLSARRRAQPETWRSLRQTYVGNLSARADVAWRSIPGRRGLRHYRSDPASRASGVSPAEAEVAVGV